jgi:30S ribosomal protein S31
MGKGDKKTKKGKISMGSFGVTRPKRKKKVDITAAKAKPAKAKKADSASKEDKPKKSTKKKEA